MGSANERLRNAFSHRPSTCHARQGTNHLHISLEAWDFYLSVSVKVNMPFSPALPEVMVQHSQFGVDSAPLHTKVIWNGFSRERTKSHIGNQSTHCPSSNLRNLIVPLSMPPNQQGNILHACWTHLLPVVVMYMLSGIVQFLHCHHRLIMHVTIIFISKWKFRHNYYCYSLH